MPEHTAKATDSPAQFAELRLLTVLLGILSLGQAADAQLRGTFVPTGDMTRARAGHTATLLADGRVLITGGDGDARSTELYDPATGTFVPTGGMTAARGMHTATLLPDGRVLIAGGWGLSSVELYDPAAGTFSPTGEMIEDQAGHTATLLPNGKVLIAGGERAAPPWPTAARPELYDPATGTFSLAANYAVTNWLYPTAGGPVWPTANLLRDGRVLIVGENPPEIYDSTTGTFSLTGAMIASVYRYGMDWHTSTSLKDGTVLIAGGNDDMSCPGFANAELYDPSSGTFTVVANMTMHRDVHTATLLKDGTVLVAGGGEGWCGMSTLDTAELYDPVTRSFFAVGRMTRSRSSHTATLLKDGTVLIAGGGSYWPHDTLASAELYRVAQPQSRRRGVRR
jgi:hypothetical protein